MVSVPLFVMERVEAKLFETSPTSKLAGGTTSTAPARLVPETVSVLLAEPRPLVAAKVPRLVVVTEMPGTVTEPLTETVAGEAAAPPETEMVSPL